VPELAVVEPSKVMFLLVNQYPGCLERFNFLPCGSGPPTFADDEITGAGEADRVAIVSGAEVHIAAGLVVLVIVLALHEFLSNTVEVKVWRIDIWISGWGRKRARNSG